MFQNEISSVVVIRLLNIVLKLCVLEIDGPVSLKHLHTATFLGHDAAFLNFLFYQTRFLKLFKRLREVQCCLE